MELKEIRNIVLEILNDIEQNKYNYTYRKYDTIFEQFGMLKRRDFNELKRIERQFKNKNITFWQGREQIKNLSDFNKNSIITFKLHIMDDFTKSTKTTKVNFAGKINISKSESGICPYKHQEEAFYNLQKKIIKSEKNPFAGLLVLPTGGGKTLTAGFWLAKNFLDKNKKVLWVAHRHELLEQAKNTFTQKLAYKDIFQEKDSFHYRIISGIHDKPINVRPTDDLIIASKDSLNAGFEHLYKNWIQNHTDEIFLIIDEAHHATAKTYRKLIENLKTRVSKFKLLGLTATPSRTAEHEQGLLKKVFPDDIVYKIDLKTLIRLGILSEPIFEEVETGQNFIEDLTDDEIELLNTFDINNIGEQIAETIAKNRERNYTIVDKYVNNKEKYKQTLVFALNVDNAIALNKLFQEKGIKSDYVISNVKDAITGITTNFTKENKEKIDNFRSGNLEVLINVNILTEGTDVPDVQTVFLTRPTISTILMTQMIGRGLRGPKAGGTKDAYIVSFIDEWQDKIAWINPEKLFIEENVDFNDTDKKTKKQLIRLVSISKIEEFAILTNNIIDPETKKELEKLDFIQRIPKGIFQFKLLEKSNGEERERNCEILVYDNIESSYKYFIEILPYFVADNHLKDRDYLSEQELNLYSKQIEDEFFSGTEKYPAYSKQDIKDLLQYYIIQDEIPQYIELKERSKYDIDEIATNIVDKDLGAKAEKELIEQTWANSEIEWQTFFNYDKRIFINEINIAKNRLFYPDLYKKTKELPTEENEIREFERMPLYEIRKINPVYEKWLRDQIFNKYTDENGYYFSAESGYKSKNRLIYQVDHIVPMHNGGLTVLENLQLLTKGENAIKGIK
jgi:superfamily II DNA or RNA helicase